MNPKIYAELWTDPHLEDVSAEVRLTFIWMFSNPMIHMTGTFQITPKRFMFETGLDKQWLEETLATLQDKFVQVGDLVWIKSFIRWQFGCGENLRQNNIARGLVRSMGQLPVDIQKAILAVYPELMDIPEKGLASPSKPSRSPSKPSRSPSKPLPLPGLYDTSPSKPFEALPSSMPALVSSQSHTHTNPSPSTRASEALRRGNVHVQEHKNVQGDARGDAEPVTGAGEDTPGYKPRYDLALEVVCHLGKKTGQDFSRANQGVLMEPALRLHEVNYDVEGVKRMIDRQVASWSGNARMAEYLRPKTLFESVNFHNYYAARDVAIQPGANRGDVEARRKVLQEQIDTCRANKQSTWFSPEHTPEEANNLKKWRAELGALQA